MIIKQLYSCTPPLWVHSACRESNFELLRIIAMFLIVLIHLCGYGISNEQYLGGMRLNKAIYAASRISGNVGNSIFFMLTGYFLVQSEMKLAKIKKLFFQVLFYVFIALLVFIIPYKFGFYNYPDLEKKQILHFLFNLTYPISGGTWWFITTYTLLYFISDSINKYLRPLTRKQFLILLTIMLILNAFRWTNSGIYNPLLSVSLAYAIGAFFRIHIQKVELQFYKYYVAILIVFLLWCIGSYAEMYVIQHFSPELSIKQKLLAMIINCVKGIPTLVISCILFYLAMNTHITYNKFINYISSCTLAVYLFHESPFAGQLLWKKIFNVSIQFESKYFGVFVLCDILAVFLMTIVLETLRRNILCVCSSRRPKRAILV